MPKSTVTRTNRTVPYLLPGLAAGALLAVGGTLLASLAFSRPVSPAASVLSGQAGPGWSQLAKEGWPPEPLHFDASAAVTSKLTLGDTPLSYGYLFAHPDSDYSRALRDISQLVIDGGDRLVFNFRAAERPGYDVDMIMGAACVTDQDEEAFYDYHRAVLASPDGLSRDEIVSLVAQDPRLDAARFGRCFDQPTRRRMVVDDDWDPESLSVEQFASQTWADGLVFHGAFDFCNDDRGIDQVREVVGCLKELLAEAEQYGSLSSFSEDRLTVSTGQASDFLRESGPGQAVFLVRDNSRRLWQVRSYASDGQKVALVSFTDRFGSNPSVWLEGGRLRFLAADLSGLTTVGLQDGQVSQESLPDGLAAQNERLISFLAFPRQLILLVCESSYVPEYCRLTLYDRLDQTVESAPLGAKLRLYEGASISRWDPAERRATVITGGGDAGIVYGAEYVIDLDAGETETVDNFDAVPMYCGSQESQEVICSSAELKEVDRFRAWQRGRSQDTGGNGDCDWAFDGSVLKTSPGRYLGCYPGNS